MYGATLDPDWRPSPERVEKHRRDSVSFYPRSGREEITVRKQRIELHQHYYDTELASTYTSDPKMRESILLSHMYWIGMHKAVIEAIVLETITE